MADLSDIPMSAQAAYADLVERAWSAAFAEAFADPGIFTPKEVRGRRYWYFQAAGSRRQRYVGVETPELLEHIEWHRSQHRDRRDRHSVVSMLVRASLPRPLPAIGNVLMTLADAGVFRLRAVLVGTIAYQTYPAMLGVRLGSAAIQTNDIDIAQFSQLSIAVEDTIGSALEVLRRADPSFQPVATAFHASRVVTCEAAGGLRVDFLTPNRGPDTEEPMALPALGTDAQPLRFLDFLIRDPERAVVLHGPGVPVVVPSPARFAVHKLIVSRRRRAGTGKGDKDIAQAAALLGVLADRRPEDLRAAWVEAFARGPTWQQLLGEGLRQLKQSVRDRALRAVGAPRAVAHLDLVFGAAPPRWDGSRDAVVLLAQDGTGASVRCLIPLDALAAHFGVDGHSDCVHVVRRNLGRFQDALRRQFADGPIEAPGEVILRSADLNGNHRRHPLANPDSADIG